MTEDFWLCRGKEKNTNKWRVGFFCIVEYIRDNKKHPIIFPECVELYGPGEFSEFYFVIPETLGLYTGLTDNNGTKLFEGDIVCGVSEFFGSNAPVGVIRYDCCRFVIDFGYSKNGGSKDIEYLGDWNEDVIVIGNIHDHTTEEECK